jgi:ribonuclease E
MVAAGAPAAIARGQVGQEPSEKAAHTEPTIAAIEAALVARPVVAPPIAIELPRPRGRRSARAAAVATLAGALGLALLVGRLMSSSQVAAPLARSSARPELVLPEASRIEPAQAPVAATAPTAAPPVAALEPEAQGADPVPARPVLTAQANRPPRPRRPLAEPGQAEVPEAPAAAPAAAAPAAAAPAAIPAATSPSDDRSVDDLLDAALTRKRAAQPVEEEAAEPDLPALTKDDIRAALKVLRPKMKECYRQHHVRGVALVRISVGQEGEVVAAAVSGPLGASPTAECVSAAVKTASFPASKGMSFDYPFAVR